MSLATDYCPHCTVTHVIGEHPREDETQAQYWKRMHENQYGDILKDDFNPRIDVVEEALTDGSTVFAVTIEVEDQKIKIDAISEGHANRIFAMLDGAHDITKG